MQLPLVGGEAPDFMAEAVFDQEFQTVTLSQYRVRLPIIYTPIGELVMHDHAKSCPLLDRFGSSKNHQSVQM